MSKISYKVVYNRKNKLNKEGKALIQIECYLNGKRKYYSTGIKIEPVYWHNKYRRVKNNHSASLELNRIINKQLRKFEDLEFKISEEKGEVSLNDIDNNKDSESKNDNFLEFCFDSLESNTALRDTTRKQQRTILGKLRDYKKHISFKDLNYSFLEDYDNYLRNMGLHQNTIANQHKVLKTYINKAIKKELLSADDYPYRNFKVKKIPTNRPFLTLNEVENIERLIFTENTRDIEKVRDMFVFSCYTGVRFEDVQNLKNENIIQQNGEYILEFKQLKTQEFLTLPVSLLFDGKAIGIINKYKDTLPKSFLFHQISNQKANVKLKLIAILSRITKTLSYHVSRHTFGTNLAAATSDQFLVRELMGHSDIKTSMIYIHISQEQIRNKLKNTKW